MAGSGLRLTGNNGRFRGHFRIGEEGDRFRVAELIRKTGVDVVKSLDGEMLQDEDIVEIGKKVKAVLQNGQSTLLVFTDQGVQRERIVWHTCTKEQLKIF